ncbi:MAG: DNA topoisomerase (ATP-hydrolyzing) subunit B [Planctomycetes bacterium]|nr:DNA topoisomerase (ATP-hydrolyzing) subunit B [Planctomycetota bacterium]
MSKTYDSSSIQVLEGLEAVRKRPAMYIGDTSSKGLHHCVFEVVDNSIDEALAGYCSRIEVIINEDGSVTVIDDGRGIPVDVHPTEKVPAVEVILCKLHAGGKFDKGTYKVSGGLHGVGVSCVNALSDRLTVEITRDGGMWEQTFSKGKKTTELRRTGNSSKHGTKLTFHPDATIFETVEFSYEVLAKRMREMAFLMGRVGLVITLADERTGRRDEYVYPNGLEDFIAFVNVSKQPLHEQVISVHSECLDSHENSVEIDLALQYNDTYREDVYTFVNNINTTEGGTHLSGFRAGLTRALNTFAKKDNLLKQNEPQPGGDDFREGLAAILSVKLSDPQFESQTKIKLGNREVEGLVASAVFEKLDTLFEENPALGRVIVNKALLAARAREAARKQRDLVRRKGALASGNLPGKLADCQSKQRDETELFIVEGDSAGGTAKSARDRVFQAILPLRGKILNVEKARLDKMLNHEEIQVLIQALGAGFGSDEFDLEKLRYGKIIIMTDADVDGSHIRTLLLTFFYRQMPELVSRGRIYIAEPPLYKLRHKRNERYIVDEFDLKKALLEISLGHSSIKRLGEKAGPEIIEGETLREFVDALLDLGRYEEPFVLGKRGLSFEDYLRRGAGGSFPRHAVIDLEGLVTTFADDDSFHEHLDALPEESREALTTVDFHQADEIARATKRLTTLGLTLEDYLHGGGEPRFSVLIDEKEYPADNLRVVVDTMRRVAEESVDIQRYKGLGEMNAEQLWESTMDPTRRTLHLVALEDEVAADNLFSILMGTQVEPRRAFIEKHALEVRNLDV